MSARHTVFRFEHKNNRHIAFIDYAALARLGTGHPVKVFEKHLRQILRTAAGLADHGRFDADDAIRVESADLKARRNDERSGIGTEAEVAPEGSSIGR